VDGSGARTSDAVNISAHWFPGVLHVLLEVTSPAEARVHVLLEDAAGRQKHQSRLRILAINHQPFCRSTNGAMDRLAMDSVTRIFSRRSIFLGGANGPGPRPSFGARDCDLLVSKPGPSDRTHYAEVQKLARSREQLSVYVETTLKGSGGVKEFTYFGLRQNARCLVGNPGGNEAPRPRRFNATYHRPRHAGSTPRPKGFQSCTGHALLEPDVLFLD